MIILYSEDVEADLNAIAEYIAADNPRRAMMFIRRFTVQSNASVKARCFINCALTFNQTLVWRWWAGK